MIHISFGVSSLNKTFYVCLIAGAMQVHRTLPKVSQQKKFENHYITQ